MMKFLHRLSVIVHLKETISTILSKNLKVLRDQPRESCAPGCSSLRASGLTPFLGSLESQSYPSLDTSYSLADESYHFACSVVQEGRLLLEY